VGRVSSRSDELWTAIETVLNERPFAFGVTDKAWLGARVSGECVAALERAGRDYQWFRSADSAATRSKVRRDMKTERRLLYAVCHALAPLAEGAERESDRAGAWHALHALGVDVVRAMHARAIKRTEILTKAIAESSPPGPPQMHALTGLKRAVRDVLAQHGVRGALRDVIAARAVSSIIGRKTTDPLRSLRA
jgi:hypothetical protein